MNRAQRRFKQKPRGFTKKGNTRVIFVNDNGQAFNIPTKIGSGMHKKALANVKRMKKAKRGH